MKLDILMHYELNEQTGEVTFIGKEEVVVDTAKKVSKTTINNSEPCIKLNANNYALSQAACELLKVSVGDTLHINYPKVDGNYIPAIGNSEAFNVKSGNKITKSLTVSYRGSANNKLAEFGDTFELIPSERDGIFYLKGNKIIEVKHENAIEIDDTFELDDLEDLDLNESTDISTIDLTL